MKKAVIGILAHVDAGKTTLSEAMLYLGGSIRKMGRVDNGDAFLDTDELEKERGITIFSKQAVLTWKDVELTLLDTPGHVDFSAETERTLQVLDYAILLVNGSDGVQGHTQTLWRLLKRDNIPVFVFVNKMDQEGANKGRLLEELRERLSGDCVDFSKDEGEQFWEQTATCDEEALEQFLDKGRVERRLLCRLIRERKIFPCLFGSALRVQGVDGLLDMMERYIQEPDYPEQFGARVFKISRDGQGARLTHMKITGGRLRVKELLSGGMAGTDAEDTGFGGGDRWEEKINQIRFYRGERYETTDAAEAGDVCAVTGLSHTLPGDGLGWERGRETPALEPVLSCRVSFPEDCDAAAMLPKLRSLEEEVPELHLVWDEQLKEIQARIMGEVQIEVLSSLIRRRFGVEAEFEEGDILYKETIANVVEGVGHFEPLRHYAEVHLLMEPGEEGSGLCFASGLSRDELDMNWQRQILSQLREGENRGELRGVLTGSPVTDMKITLVAGRAHPKHTEGGDFRQAAFRAVRQGLMQARSVLLEPWYEFRLEVPEGMVGRAMTDVEKKGGTFGPPRLEGETAILCGRAPVSSIRGYQREITAYTKGCGRLFCTFGGYSPCHNAEEVVERKGYTAERDTAHPSGSVFCSHGAGIVVEWDEVEEYMHLESWLKTKGREVLFPGKGSGSECGEEAAGRPGNVRDAAGSEEKRIGSEEVEEILTRASYANRRDKALAGRRSWGRKEEVQPRGIVPDGERRKIGKTAEEEREYLLVDGYNVIYTWEELSDLAKVNMDGARGRLMDILCNYQAVRGVELIVVFDAYRVKGHDTEAADYHNIHVVFTKEAETADQYIERFAHENGRKHKVTVATSDGLEQIIIRGAGCLLISARELEAEVEQIGQKACGEFHARQPLGRNRLGDMAAGAQARRLADIAGDTDAGEEPAEEEKSRS